MTLPYTDWPVETDPARLRALEGFGEDLTAAVAEVMAKNSARRAEDAKVNALLAQVAVSLREAQP